MNCAPTCFRSLIEKLYMSTSITTNKHISIDQHTTPPAPRWQILLLWILALAVLLIAIFMRLYHLGAPFDRDGYDEGVYWQSLRSMAAGHTLYQQIFYSQPPFFLLSIYPFFVLFGSTLWSARFGITMISLLGFLGAFLLGQAINKRLGGIVGMLLLTFDPLYFTQSQKLQAEAPAAAFSLLAVGTAYLWWDNPDTTAGLYLAAVSAIALVLGTLCKLYSLSSIIPIGLLLLTRLWQIWRHYPHTNRRSFLPILVYITACLITALIILLPFTGTYSTLLQQVITFHTTAGAALIADKAYNKVLIENFLQANPLLVIAALYGLLVGLVRRDWRVLPLLGWSLATLYLLWQQVPLFSRHFVALTPALICLAVIGLASSIQLKNARESMQNNHKSRSNHTQGTDNDRSIVGTTLAVVLGEAVVLGLAVIMGRRAVMRWGATALALLLILATVAVELPQYPSYYTMVAQRSHDTYATLQMRVADDVRNAIAPDQYIITDGQFIAALADRNTPPDLVDTSMVRIASGYLKYPQLITDASQPQVHAILFFTNRLKMPQLTPFFTWVTHHFHLKTKYGNGEELWVR